MSLFQIFDVAASGMAAQSVRLNTTASNLANADSVSSDPTTVYRARTPVFAAVKRALDNDGNEGISGVKVTGVTTSPAPTGNRYDPDNPLADASGHVYTSNVNPIEEMVNMISASRSYENNVEVISTTKRLMMRTLELGRM